MRLVKNIHTFCKKRMGTWKHSTVILNCVCLKKRFEVFKWKHIACLSINPYVFNKTLRVFWNKHTQVLAEKNKNT